MVGGAGRAMAKKPIGIDQTCPGFLSWALRQPSPKKDVYLQFFSGTPMTECARDLGLPLADVRAALLELCDKRLAFAEDRHRMAFLAAKSRTEFCGVTGQTEGVYDLLQIRFGSQVMSTSATSSAYAAVSDQARRRAERQKAREGQGLSRGSLAFAQAPGHRGASKSEGSADARRRREDRWMDRAEARDGARAERATSFAPERGQRDLSPAQSRRVDQAKADERREQRRAAKQAARASREAPEPIERKHKAKAPSDANAMSAQNTDVALPPRPMKSVRLASSAHPVKTTRPAQSEYAAPATPSSSRAYYRDDFVVKFVADALAQFSEGEIIEFGVFVKRFNDLCRKASIPPSALPPSAELRKQLDRSKKVVWAGPSSFWLYDWKRYAPALLADLKRSAKINCEYSARLFFAKSQSLMSESGVGSPEQLFEIYRRAYLGSEDAPKFGDNLSVGFGRIDRREQVRRFVEARADMAAGELARRYEKEFGFPAKVASTWIELFADDIFADRARRKAWANASVRAEAMAEKKAEEAAEVRARAKARAKIEAAMETERRTEVAAQDAEPALVSAIAHTRYPVKELEYLERALRGKCCDACLIRDRFERKFPQGGERLSGEALKLGYFENQGLFFGLEVVPSAYFEELLSGTPYFSVGDVGFEEGVTRHPEFRAVLKRRLQCYQELVYDSGGFATSSHLCKATGASLADISSYGRTAVEAATSGEPFTVASLHADPGFSHPLVELQMPTAFYESLIALEGRAKVCKFAGTKGFLVGEASSFTAADFLRYVVSVHGGLDRAGLALLLEKEYGIDCPFALLSAVVHNAGLYYDDIGEGYYTSKE